MRLIESAKTTLTFLGLGTLALIFTTGAGKPSTSSGDIPLCVTIHNAGALASDGAGDYCHRKNGVTAVFTADQGRFSFDTGTRRLAGVDFGVALDPGAHRIHFLVSRDTQDPNVNDPELRDPNWQDLHLDQLPIGAQVAVGLLFFVRTKQTGNWVVGFGDYPEPTEVNHWPCGASSPATVTRLDANTWTLASDTAEDHCLHHGTEFQGRIAFPFQMTMKRMSK